MLDQQTAQFLAVAGEERALGVTPREALDALMARLPVETLPPIMILPYNRGMRISPTLSRPGCKN